MNVFDVVKINESRVSESQSFTRKSIEERRPKCSNPDPEFLSSGIYSTWMENHEWLCWLDYALDPDPKRLRENVATALEQRLRHVRRDLANRETNFIKYPDGYDLGAIEDYSLAEIFSLFVILNSREQIIPICRETNYGRYGGKPKLDHHYAIICRILRAYFLEDDTWLAEEIEKLVQEPVSRDLSFSFSLPKSKWHPLMHSLFYGDKDTYLKNIRWLAKWYGKRVITKGQIAYLEPHGFRYPPEPGDESFTPPGLLINLLLLLTLKIANAYRGYGVTIDDPFLPMNLIELS